MKMCAKSNYPIIFGWTKNGIIIVISNISAALRQTSQKQNFVDHIVNLCFFLIVQKKTSLRWWKSEKRLNYRSIHRFDHTSQCEKRSLQSFTYFGLNGNGPWMCEKPGTTCLTQFFRRWMHKCLRRGSTPFAPSPHSKYLDPRDSTYFFS